MLKISAAKTECGFLFAKLHHSEISALHYLDFNFQILDTKFLTCGVAERGMGSGSMGILTGCLPKKM